MKCPCAKLLFGLLFGAGLLFLPVKLAVADSTLVFPQLVTGGGYVSVITLVNTSSTAAVTGTLSFFSQNGEPRSVAIDGQSTGTSLSGIKIPPLGTSVFSTTPTAGDPIAGMVTFTSDNRAGGVVRFVNAGGQVGVLSAVPQSTGVLVLNTSGGNDTGVAITNPGADPINIRLTYLDEAGRVIESVDPPELNPLRPNGQVAKFVSQFGFKQAGNRDRGSIQIQVKGPGAFSAFGLLYKDGEPSSTAVIRGQTAGTFAPTFDGTYSGTWFNKSFGTAGGMTLQALVNTATATAVINLTLTGSVFGSHGGSASLIGAYNLGTFTATGTSILFGRASMTVNADGSFIFTANGFASPSVSAFKLTGVARADQITGSYVATLTDGGVADGTITLNQGAIKMQ